jgi:hypothetical protein
MGYKLKVGDEDEVKEDDQLLDKQNSKKIVYSNI